MSLLTLSTAERGKYCGGSAVGFRPHPTDKVSLTENQRCFMKMIESFHSFRIYRFGNENDQDPIDLHKPSLI